MGYNSRGKNADDQNTPAQNSVNISAIQPAMEASASYGEEGYRKLTLSAEKLDNVIVARPKMHKNSSMKLEDDFRMF